MTYYLWIKLVHILSACLLLGTGLGIAFFSLMAHRSGDVAHIARTSHWVVVADTIFTAPAVIVQLATGLWMVHELGIPLSAFWLRTSLLLFFLTGACWLPVLVLQVRMRNLARAAHQSGQALPASYFGMARVWFWLGWPAFIAVVAIVGLMVIKPA